MADQVERVELRRSAGRYRGYDKLEVARYPVPPPR
ncbi:hypothetical protein ABIB25_001419 [Nakamurella sp. UYEF19]